MTTKIETKPLRVLGAYRDGDHFRARLVFRDWSVEVKGDSVQEAEARAKALEAALDGKGVPVAAAKAGLFAITRAQTALNRVAASVRAIHTLASNEAAQEARVLCGYHQELSDAIVRAEGGVVS